MFVHSWRSALSNRYILVYVQVRALLGPAETACLVNDLGLFAP